MEEEQSGILYHHETVNPTHRFVAMLYFHEVGLNYTPKHWHRSLELVFFQSSPIRLWINGQTRDYPAGEAVIINSGDVHEITPLHYEHPRGVSVVFPYAFLQYNGVDINKLYFDQSANGAGSARLTQALLSLLTVHEGRAQDEYYIMEINAALFSLLHCIVREFQSPKTPDAEMNTTKHQERCKQIIAYINQHYASPIMLGDVARECAISEEHLSRFLKKYMGTTFKQHLNGVRLRHAFIQITDTDLPMLQIALDSGFPDYRSFSDCFHKKYHTTPYHYRQHKDEFAKQPKTGWSQN